MSVREVPRPWRGLVVATLIALATSVVVAAVAHAAEPPMPGPPPIVGQADATPGGQPGQTTSDGPASPGPQSSTQTPAQGQSQGQPAPAPQAPSQAPAKAPGVVTSSSKRVTKRCSTNRRTKVRTCRYYRGAAHFKTCKAKRGHKQRCRKVRARAAAAERGKRVSAAVIGNAAMIARAAAYLGSGWSSPVLPGVVRLYSTESSVPDKGWCSGALLARGIVLTAAHCLWNSGEEGGTPHTIAYANGALQVVPGNTVSGGKNSFPYGVWNVARTFVPSGFKAAHPNNDITLDWGLIELEPDASGHYAGDYAGTFQATWSLPDINGSTELWLTGYPATGLFRTPQYSFGENQFYCDATLDAVDRAANGAYWLEFPCKANGGVSGGPLFARKADGQWTIIGVANRGIEYNAGTAQSYGKTSFDLWADDRFGQFWTSTINTIRGS
jgi:V8-like Glu-specific endopeptidase